MMKKNIYLALAASVMMLSLASCSDEDRLMSGGTSNGKLVHMIATVNTDSDGLSRTTRPETAEEGLAFRWAEGDQLLVTSTTGMSLGILTLDDGVGQDQGSFSGDIYIEGDGQQVNVFYLGSETDVKSVAGTTFNDNFSIQEGSLTSLPQFDFMAAKSEVSLVDGQASINFNIASQLGFAHYKLNGGEGVSFDGAEVIISGTNLYNTAIFSLANGEKTMNPGNIKATAQGNDLYVIIGPAENVELTFNATMNGTEYTATLPVRTYKANRYFAAGMEKGIEVEMKKDEVDEDPSNPGNTSHWGGENINPSWETLTPTKVSETDGWTLNVRSVYDYGGFGTYVKYNSNGLQNGLLTSKGTTAYFFQWGRWLGFPSTCGRTIFNSNGSYSGNNPNSSQYLNGVNIYNTNVGYIFNDLMATYASCYMGNDSWTNERAMRSSIIFGMVSSLNSKLDYVGKNEECEWEERSGNPCPDGYRIPTAKELEALIPSTGRIEGSLTEIKEIDGINYAMQWKVNTSTTIPCVEIKSVKVTSKISSVDDVNFDNANIVRLPAYGYLDNEADLQMRGTVGVYWSCESGANSISGTTGMGGKYLEIDFEGNIAIMGMDVAPRCFGACVLPIKDANAKSSSIMPWFPVTF